jgi:hypothetical protein
MSTSTPFPPSIDEFLRYPARTAFSPERFRRSHQPQRAVSVDTITGTTVNTVKGGPSRYTYILSDQCQDVKNEFFEIPTCGLSLESLQTP